MMIESAPAALAKFLVKFAGRFGEVRVEASNLAGADRVLVPVSVTRKV